MATLLIADDDAGFRGSIRRVLERDPDTTVIGEAADGEEAVRLAKMLHPKIVLMDITMPQMNGLEALRLTKQALPDTKIIVVTIHDEEPYRAVAMAGGADGFVLKKSLATELFRPSSPHITLKPTARRAPAWLVAGARARPPRHRCSPFSQE